MTYPSWAEAYCFECHKQQPITALLGLRRYGEGVWAAAVRQLCGHERHGPVSRVVISGKNLKLLQDWLVEQHGVAGALTMSG